MKKEWIFVFFCLVLMIMTVTTGVSAQEIDVSTMTNEELTDLLQRILIKLQQEEDAETAVPTPGPLAVEETPQFSIWENKKLIIEGLPDYMFISGRSGDSGDPDDSNPSDPQITPEPDTHDCPSGCQWICPPVMPSVLPCGCYCG